MEEVLHKLLQAKREFGWRDEGMLIEVLTSETYEAKPLDIL